jgi:hypothetical protein
MGKRGGGSGDVAEYMVELQVHLAGKRVSDGKVLCCKTRQVKHHAATALRMGANSLRRAKGYFGEFIRRMSARLRTPHAITPPHAKSHEFPTTSYRQRNPRQKLSSTVVMIRHSGEPKCVSANRQLDSASNSFPSRQR